MAFGEGGGTSRTQSLLETSLNEQTQLPWLTVDLDFQKGFYEIFKCVFFNRRLTKDLKEAPPQVTLEKN